MDHHEERWYAKGGLYLPIHPDRDLDGGVWRSIDWLGTDRSTKDHPVLGDQRRMDSESQGPVQQDMAPVVRSVGRRPGSPVWHCQIKNCSHQGVHPEGRIDAEDQPYDEITMDAMNIVHQFRNNLIEPGGQEQYLARIKLIDYIVERKRVQTSGCRHCPHCLNETPTKLAVCLVCWTELESCGIRPYRLQAPEDDEDEATKKELDEEVRRQEESLFKDTVHQAQENVSESNDYGFNPDEVDYNEGDDEEMDQEEETQQEDDEIV